MPRAAHELRWRVRGSEERSAALRRLHGGRVQFGSSVQRWQLHRELCREPREVRGIVDEQTDNFNCGGCGLACTGGTTCALGKCQCPTGTIDCNGACVDTTRDRANCGGCGATFACAQFKACVDSKCVCTDARPSCCRWRLS